MILKKMIIKYVIWILASLKAIHGGDMLTQIENSIKLGLLVSIPTFATSFIVEHLTSWWLGNYDYIIMVLFAIAIDHLLGSWKHAFIKKDWSILKNLGGLGLKIGMVVTVGFLFEGLNVIVKQDTVIKDYLITVTRLIVFLYPAGSAFGSASIITGGVFPPTAWLDKLKQFQTNLNPKDLNNPNN